MSAGSTGDAWHGVMAACMAAMLLAALPAGLTRAAFLLFAGTAFGGRRLATPGQRVTYRVGVAGEIALAGAMAHMLLVMP